VYEIRHGIPCLLPDYDDTQKRYLQNYETIAQDDLKEPFISHQSSRVAALLKFIGDVRGRKILDIGSANGMYLRDIKADFKVACDIALPYLLTFQQDDGVVPILGDAEYLPFKPGFFDVIILAGVLEHFLRPEMVVQRLYGLCTDNTRIIVEIPWEEDITAYRDMPYEFVHLRSFNAYKFSELWVNFYIRRTKGHFPDLRYPFIFQLEGKIPQELYNWLVFRYFFKPNIAEGDFQWRNKIPHKLPRGERVLLKMFGPVYRMFDMRRRRNSYEMKEILKLLTMRFRP
jgi:SAM-dependent methyltransferase